jgi:uncharacterized protein (TIGR02118 family)
MRVAPLTLVAAALSLAACGGSKSSETAAAGGDTAAASAAAATGAAASTSDAPTTAGPAPTASVVVLYNEPKDTAAFEKYYREKHVPLVGQHATEIGFTRAVLTKFDRAADGSKPRYYREAQLWFDSEDALKKGMATAGFKAVGGDFPNFVTNGGPTILISHETK